jgi:site-specific recombinase XerD
MTLLMTGIRVSELVALDCSDVDVSDRKGSLGMIKCDKISYKQGRKE